MSTIEISEADKKYLKLLFSNYDENRDKIFNFIEDMLDFHQEELQEMIGGKVERRTKFFVPIKSFKFGDKNEI